MPLITASGAISGLQGPLPPATSTYAPTAPGLGVASNILGKEGIDVGALPFLNVGGQLLRSDYGMSIAGGRPLTYLIGLKQPGEVASILAQSRAADLLSQGYTRSGNIFTKDLGGGMLQRVNLNLTTGDFNTFMEQLQQPQAYRSNPVDNILKAIKGSSSASEKAKFQGVLESIYGVPTGVGTPLLTSKTTTSDKVGFQTYMEPISGQISRLFVRSPAESTTTYSTPIAATPVSSSKGMSYFGGGTAAPTGASVTRNVAGGVNIRLPPVTTSNFAKLVQSNIPGRR